MPAWPERAQAWDDHLASLERQKWTSRRLALREKEWSAAEKLLEKAEQMLMFPVISQETEDGQVIIRPADWRFRDIPDVVNAASRLGRLAAEMSTERVSLDWRKDAEKAGYDPDTIFTQLFAAFEGALGPNDDNGGLEGGPASEDVA